MSGHDPFYERFSPRVLLLITFLAVPLVVGGCRSINGSPLAETVRPTEPFCVARHEKDERNLAVQVAESLSERGMPARAVDVDQCPADDPYRVTYIDNWSWDMRMYLAKMTIEVIDTRSGEIVAYGESKQGSLGAMGMSHRDVIDRAVSALLDSEKTDP